MSIKNPHIIHFIRNKKYLCNHACSITKSKSIKDKLKVTCENCLRKLYKGERKSI